MPLQNQIEEQPFLGYCFLFFIYPPGTIKDNTLHYLLNINLYSTRPKWIDSITPRE